MSLACIEDQTQNEEIWQPYTDLNIVLEVIIGFAEQHIYRHQLRSLKKLLLKASQKAQGEMVFWDQVQKDMRKVVGLNEEDAQD